MDKEVWKEVGKLKHGEWEQIKEWGDGEHRGNMVYGALGVTSRENN